MVNKNRAVTVIEIIGQYHITHDGYLMKTTNLESMRPLSNLSLDEYKEYLDKLAEGLEDVTIEEDWNYGYPFMYLQGFRKPTQSEQEDIDKKLNRTRITEARERKKAEEKEKRLYKELKKKYEQI